MFEKMKEYPKNRLGALNEELELNVKGTKMVESVIWGEPIMESMRVIDMERKGNPELIGQLCSQPFYSIVMARLPQELMRQYWEAKSTAVFSLFSSLILIMEKK